MIDTATKRQTIHRKLSGVVTSDKMDKTIVVKVERRVQHPKYRKFYIQSEKFHVHDEKNQYKVGDVVEFCETRPLSKTKRWRVIYPKQAAQII